MELKKGETIMTDAALHLPASFLHEAFSDRSGVPLDFFELYYRGKRLEGEAALASWGIGKGSTIEVKMRGRGGTSNQKGKQPKFPEEEPSLSSNAALAQRWLSMEATAEKARLEGGGGGGVKGVGGGGVGNQEGKRPQKDWIKAPSPPPPAPLPFYLSISTRIPSHATPHHITPSPPVAALARHAPPVLPTPR